MAIRLMLADVDGTLVTHDKVLTDRAMAAVHQLRGAGVLFAITSGRPPRGMAMLVEPLDLQTPIAAFNGGEIVDRAMAVMEVRRCCLLGMGVEGGLRNTRHRCSGEPACDRQASGGRGCLKTAATKGQKSWNVFASP